MKKIDFKLKHKDPGFSIISLCLICLMMITLIVTFTLKMKMYHNTKTFVDDAITNANLSAAIIDGYDYGENGSITNFNYDSMYKQYLTTLSYDLGADVVDGEFGVTLTPKKDIHFDSDVTVLKFYVYNKTSDGTITLAKVVDSSDTNRGTKGVYYGGSLEKTITEDKAISPSGVYLDDEHSCMMIYSQISFDLNGVFGKSDFYKSDEYPMYRVKHHAVDVVSSHKYEDIEKVEPNCLDAGYIIYECTDENCPDGTGHRFTLPLPALGHDFATTPIYEDNNGIPNGHRYNKCSRCDATTNHQYRVYLTKDNYIESVSGDGYYTPGAGVTINAITKPGSIWNGWLGTYQFNEKTNSFVMPEYAVALSANSSASYTVKHWLQKINAESTQNETNYDLVDQKTFITTDISATPEVNTYTGFTSPLEQTVIINPDGSTVINYYYTRNKYTVTLNAGTGIDSVSGAGSYYYGEEVTIDATIKNGYKWSEWKGDSDILDQRYTFVMSNHSVSYTATASTKTYKIQYIPNLGIMPQNYPTEYTVENNVEFPEPTRDGYNFLGWYRTVDFSDNPITNTNGLSEDLILYAKWGRQVVTVTYDAGGGTFF